MARITQIDGAEARRSYPCDPCPAWFSGLSSKQVPVELAEGAMREIRKADPVLAADDAAQLDVHAEGHVFVVPTAMTFLDRYLR